MKRLSLLLVLVAGPALAQENVPEMIDGHQVFRPAVTQLEFDGLKVEAGMVKPEATLSSERRSGVFHPMIVVRANFEPEMAASIDEVK